jgi:2'-5' RNA ligase
LNVKKGNDELIKIHDRLYTGILREYLVRDISYIPHITVGSLKNKEDFSKAVDQTASFNTNFTTVISDFVTEIITEEEKSIVEFKISL